MKGQLMKRDHFSTMGIVVITILFFSLETLQAETPQRLRRAESFFGLHFDFHAGPDCTEVGKNTTPEMVNRLIDMIKPDYVQVDSKGHAGYTSYPTKAGNPVPGFVGDQLKVWREETAKRGVALYSHYSGVWDMRAIELRPGWAAIDATGKPNKNMVSVFGPYVDQLLIPQLKELAEYGLDGVWVDGECWATVPDYGDRAVKLFRETTGIETIPKSPADPHWFEWLQFHREAFRNYMRHYVAEVKTEYPHYQICGNWAFTDHMPESVSVPVDFLSGDYPAGDAITWARYSGRLLVHQGIPWDLMAWSFSHPVRNLKTAEQLKREAAVVLALGGGFQAYFQQRRDGSINLEEVSVMTEVAKFVRERQPYCHRSVQIPQIALLNSTAAFQRNSPGLFARYDEPDKVRGVLECLLEGQNSVDVVSESTLRNMDRYPLIVIPEWSYLQRTFCENLAEYVKKGGSLLVIGDKAVPLFTDVFDVKVDYREPVIFEKFGKGQVALIPQEIGRKYHATLDEQLRTLVNTTVRQLFPTPKVEVTGSPWVDVSVSQLRGQLTIHLVNTSGPHRDTDIMDSIEPIGPLKVMIRSEVKPKKITLQPDGKNCPFTYQDNIVSLEIDTIPIYSIVVAEE